MTDEHHRDDLRDLLAAYTLDAVDDDERTRIDELIADDPAARAEVARYEDAIAALAADDVAVVPPAGAWAGIQARIAASPRPVGRPASAPHGGFSHEDPEEPEGPLAPVVPLTPVRPAPGPGQPTAPPAAGLPPTAGQPPAVDQPPSADQPPAVTPLAGRRSAAERRPRWRPALAAAAVVALLVMALGVVRLSTRPESRSSQVAEALATALAEPGTRLGRLSGSAGDAGVVLAPNGRGFVTTGGLEQPSDGKVYQLWALDSGSPVSLGIVEDDQAVASFTAPADSRTLALSIEDDPGAAQPTLPPVATAQIA
jgi:anti-sigma-K factor RskA